MVKTTSGAAVGLAPAIPTGRLAAGGRLYFLDNLRVALTVLVIAHHAGQAYGPTGGWWPFGEATRAPILGAFFTIGRSFLMSLSFMICGYFVVKSCDADGPLPFLKSRLQRLGLPLLGWAAVMIPLMALVFRATDGGPGPVLPVDVEHMWFVEHLLIFSACYGLWRALQRVRPQAAARRLDPPGFLPVIAFTVALALVLAVVRVWYPIDHWVYLLDFVKVAWADIPRDLSFFVIGTLAYRHDWFQTFPRRAGYVWLSIGIIAAGLWFAYDGALSTELQIGGGLLAVIRPLWETVLCCGLCIGLTVVFREQINFQGGLAKALAQSQYAAFVFHLPVVLMFQGLMLGVALAPLAKFALVTLAAVPLTFVFSSWVRKPLHI